MADHTPEPWTAEHLAPYVWAITSARERGDDDIARIDWRALSDRDGDYFSEQCEATAKRIVACVNACAGIPTEQLRRGGVADLVLVLQGILDEPDNDMTLDSLEAARDALAPFRKD